MMDVNIDLNYQVYINHGGQLAINFPNREEYRRVSAVHGSILADAVGKPASLFHGTKNLLMVLGWLRVNSKSILIGFHS